MINNMSNEEIAEIVKNDPNMMMYLGLSRDIKELKDEFANVKAEQKIYSAELNSHKHNLVTLAESQVENDGKLIKLENKLDTFKHDDTGAYQTFKKSAQARVHRLVGEKGTVIYILFYDSFIRKVYPDIYINYNANNSGNIKMEYAKAAIENAKVWKPKPAYIHKILNKYRNMEDNGTLKEPKLSAYHKYLEMTEGGTKIDF